MLFFLWLLATTAMAAVSQPRYLHKEGGTGARSSFSSSSMLHLTIQSRVAGEAPLQDLLEAALARDHCELVAIGSTSLVIHNYKVYCPALRQMGMKARLAMNHTETLLEAAGYKVEWYRVSEYKNPPVFRERDPVPGSVQESWHGRDRYDARSANYRPRFLEEPAPWALSRIDMRYGPLLYEYMYTYLGNGVDIYIIDTGIRTTHQEFASAYGGPQRASFLVNTVGDGINNDCAGHGTFVASQAGGLQYGVAKNVTLYSVKVLDCAGDGDSFTIATGIAAVLEQVASQPGRRAIASMSLGGSTSGALDAAVLSLVQAGVFVAVAAGNEQSDACQFSPSRLGTNAGVMTVGASTQGDARPYWSNYGSCVSLTAPGDQILGAWYTSDTATDVLSGTSMATPLVSGVAAIVLEQAWQTPSQTKNLLVGWATADIITGTSVQGNASSLLYALIVDSEPLPPQASPPFAGVPYGPGPGGGPDRETSPAVALLASLSLLLVVVGALLLV
jgi:subtilisin family serine protease